MTGIRSLALVSCLWIVFLAEGAAAWKPTTHLFLAETALSQIENGKVSIDLLDRTGKKIRTLGPYRVHAALTQRASSTHRDQYMAGVVGPDAYPDMMTGQMNIHPPVARSVHGSEFGTDAFLTHLWKAADKERSNKTLKRSFVLGYLTHAAGDMFAHTLVNHYAGGAFKVGPNAARHIVMESYIGKRAVRNRFVPKLVPQVRNFVFRTLTRANPKSDLKNKLLRTPKGEDPEVKILLAHLPPRYYSRLRNKLQSDIKRYDGLPKFHIERADFGVIQNYRKAWRRNIDTGLAEWVKLSDKLGSQIMWAKQENFAQAQKDAEKYARLHFLAMNGAPKELGVAAQAVEDIKNNILRAIGVRAVEDAVRDLAKNTLDHVIRAMTGQSLDHYKKLVTNPGQEFNPLFQRGPKPITLREFNTQELHVKKTGMTGDTWDWRAVPAAYNTVTMTKLLFMTQSEVNRFLGDLAKQVDPREQRREKRAGSKRKAKKRAKAKALGSRTKRKTTGTVGRKLLPGFTRRGEEGEAEGADEGSEEEFPELTPEEEEALMAEVDAELEAEGLLGDDTGEEIIERGGEPQELTEGEIEEQLDPWDEFLTVAPEPDDEMDLPEEIQMRAIEAEIENAEVTERGTRRRRRAPTRYAPKLTKPNIMLGFLQSIDSSNQFMANVDKGDKSEGRCKPHAKRIMVLSRHKQYFFGVFKDQTGLKKSCLRQLRTRSK